MYSCQYSSEYHCHTFASESVVLILQCSYLTPIFFVNMDYWCSQINKTYSHILSQIQVSLKQQVRLNFRTLEHTIFELCLTPNKDSGKSIEMRLKFTNSTMGVNILTNPADMDVNCMPNNFTSG